MKHTLLLSLLLVSALCAGAMRNDNKDFHHTRPGDIVDQILQNVAEELEQRYPITLCGKGVSMLKGIFSHCTLCFATKGPLPQELIRRNLIQFSLELSNQLNQNKDIQPYLQEKPFKLENAHIILYIRDSNGLRLIDPDISTAEISDGNLMYRTFAKDYPYSLKNQIVESYATALKEVNDVPTTPTKPLNQ